MTGPSVSRSRRAVRSAHLSSRNICHDLSRASLLLTSKQYGIRCSGPLFSTDRKGVVLNSISGVDLALWDLLAKTRGQPVYQLLGGPVTQELLCYQPVVKVRFWPRIFLVS